MRSLLPGRRGFSVGDALIILAIVSFGLALGYPVLRRSAYDQRVADAVSGIETVRMSALLYFQANGDWPADEAAGVVPDGMRSNLPPGFGFAAGGYVLDWNRWEKVELPEPPPIRLEESDTLPPPPPLIRAIAGVTVHSAEPGLLAALLERYGAGASFVRDSSWTLIMPRESQPLGGPPAPLATPAQRRRSR